MFSKDDIITVKSWMDLGDCNYEIDHKDDSIPESGIVYCNIEHIGEFFDKCHHTDNEYIVISGFSDYEVALQAEHPVCMDMIKWLPTHTQVIPRLGYNHLQIPSPCDLDSCDIDDKYSVKCYGHTRETFNEIPVNVKKWFLVNAMTTDERIQGIPLGVGKDASEEISVVKKYGADEKQNWLYINWQNYTTERYNLKQAISANPMHWMTIIEEPKEFSKFLDELARHAFVLCPAGNGIDCYRILEAIYVGSIPIVLNSPTMQYLRDLPILIVDDWSQISYNFLREQYEKFDDVEFNLDRAKLSYWKEQINESKRHITH